MRKTYKSVLDVDLLVGGNLEFKKGSGFLGPTFQCIIGEQFYRVKMGDSHFFTNLKGMNPFSRGLCLFSLKFLIKVLDFLSSNL